MLVAVHFDCAPQRGLHATPNLLCILLYTFAFFQGAGHVVTAVRVNGVLLAVGVCSKEWTDESGRVWPAGITKEPLSLFNDATYRDCWLVRPHKPRSEAQNAQLRVAVAQLCKHDDHTGNIYEQSSAEFWHSCLGWLPATQNKFHCAELCAWLALQAGAWPPSKSTSVSIPECVKVIGSAQKIF